MRPILDLCCLKKCLRRFVRIVYHALTPRQGEERRMVHVSGSLRCFLPSFPSTVALRGQVYEYYILPFSTALSPHVFTE